MNLLTRFLIFLCFVWLQSVQADLVMVLETFRHGARETLFDWWNAKDFKHWGELTPVGMRQHYNLGQALRKIYIEEKGFLSASFNPDEMYVRSTDVNRTIISALSQLYGLYPLGFGPKIPEGLDVSFEQPPFRGFENATGDGFGLPLAFQPIPIHTVPENQDYLLKSFDSRLCPVSKDITNIIISSDVYQQMNKDYKPTFEELGRILNLTDIQVAALTVGDVSMIFDVFMDDIWLNLPIPQNISKELWTNMTVLYNFVVYHHLGSNRDISRFLSTPFFQEIIDSFDAKIASPSNPLKWKTYSAHDWSIATFTCALNMTNYQCTEELIRTGKTSALNCLLYPDFATNILFELSEEDGLYYIQIRYNGDYVNVCDREDTKCGYVEFRERLMNNLVDFKSICNRPSFYEAIENKEFLAKN